MKPASRKSLMRSLGEFVGHVRAGLVAPVEEPGAHAGRRVVEEATSRDADGRTLVIRRTVIEEVEVRSGAKEATP